ncbi:MAG: MFS transporter [Myxococcales bacterium]|nr:MAG: MFS transporter [Myxococcales bacterium]
MADVSPNGVSDATPSEAGRYAWFLASSTSWFAAHGVNQVMIPWLVVGELHASPEWTGTVQMTAMLPNLVLLLVGGVLADRREARRVLAALHALAALPPLVLAASIGSSALSIPVVMACATSLGVLTAFAHPARDSLLSQVAGQDVMRAVTGNTIAQFGAQGLGMAVAAAARWFGSAPVLVVQAAFVALGRVATRHLPERAAVPVSQGTGPGEFFAGLRFVLRSDLRAVLALVCGIGLTFNGSYYVLLPLLVRDVYGGDVSGVSLLLAMFPLGTIGGSLLLLARGGIRRKGRGLALSLAAAACCLVVAGRALPFPALVALTFAWGLAGAVFLNTSRTLFQERAPATERARVLAVNQLGFTAAGPVGALLSGFAAAHFGPENALAHFGLGMLALVATVVLSSKVAGME